MPYFVPFREPSDSTPPEPPQGTGERPAVRRPMSFAAALGWTAGTTFLFLWLGNLTALLRPGAERDLVNGVACQALAYLVGIFLILRVHAPEASIRELLGFRGTHPAFYPLAIALGVALEAPVNRVYQVIDARWPTSAKQEEALLEILAGAGTAERILIGLAIVAVGPLIEEMFFRGAIFSPMRRRHGPLAVAALTGALFAVAHVQWQVFVPIGIVGVVLGFVRATSGSLWPALLLHATFNAPPFIAMLERTKDGTVRADDEPISLAVTLVSTAAAAGLVGLTHVVGSRTRAAASARERDVPS